MLKLVIFDYDGLMVNSEELAFLAEAELLSSLNVHLGKEYFNGFLGVPVIDTLQDYKKKFALQNSIEDLVAKREEFMLKLEANLMPMEGLFALLDCARRRGIRMAIASSGKKEYVMRGLRHLGIQNLFETVVCSDEVKRGKPFPDLIISALDQVMVEPQFALMIEDSLNGVEAAKRAGVFCIAVPPVSVDRNTYKNCGLIAKDLSQVQQILEMMLPRNDAQPKPL